MSANLRSYGYVCASIMLVVSSAPYSGEAGRSDVRFLIQDGRLLLIFVFKVLKFSIARFEGHVYRLIAMGLN